MLFKNKLQTLSSSINIEQVVKTPDSFLFCILNRHMSKMAPGSNSMVVAFPKLHTLVIVSSFIGILTGWLFFVQPLVSVDTDATTVYAGGGGKGDGGKGGGGKGDGGNSYGFGVSRFTPSGGRRVYRTATYCGQDCTEYTTTYYNNGKITGQYTRIESGDGDSYGGSVNSCLVRCDSMEGYDRRERRRRVPL